MNMNMDYSFLFGGTTTGMSTGSAMLSDYASIKNGSYLKLMKAYYAKDGNDTKAKNPLLSNSISKESNKTLAAVKADAQDLQNSAEKLTTKGSKTLFKQKEVTKKAEDGTEETVKEYDMDAIYKGVKAFVDDYNDLIDSGSKAESTKLLRQTLNMTKTTKAYSNMLDKVGITIGSSNKLSIDETAFKKADMSTIKNLFNGNSSFASKVAARASMLSTAATTEAGKANTYNGTGGYSNPYSSGSLFNSYL